MMTTARLRIDSVVAGGAGLARDEGGRVVFVDGALPGEEVDVEIVEERRDYARARIQEIATASPDRVRAPCPLVAAGCGGCGWQHVDHPAQLRLKEEIVADALRRIARMRSLPQIVTSHPEVGGARTTLRMAIADGRPAFRMQASTDLVGVDACMVAHPRLSEIMAASRFPGADEVVLRIAEASGDAIALVAPAEAAAAAVVPDGVRVGAASAGGRVGPGLHVEEEVAGHCFRITGDAFFQASPGVAGALVEAVGAAAGPLSGARVIDAYGGVGLFAKAVAVAGGAASTVVIESDRLAVADARHNLAGCAARVLRCEVGRWRPSPAEVVIADPARPGLGKPGVRALLGAAPGVLVLVSCDAGSLGRDARLLLDRGYEIASVGLVDAFPHTPHIEAVTHFVAG